MRSLSSRLPSGAGLAVLIGALSGLGPAAAETPPPTADSTPASAAADSTPGSGQVQMPLVPGVAADPSITTHDGRYYLMYNKEGFADSIVMRSSPSLAGIRQAPDQVVWQGSQGPPEVRHRVGLGSWLLPWNGRWYLYGWGDDGTSVTTSIPFVLESVGDDPLGPYTFKTTFSSPGPGIGGDGHGYAASPVQVGDRLYLTQTSRDQIFLAELSDPWTIDGGWTKILEAADSGWECAGRCLVEGGSAVVRGGSVRLLFSAGEYDSPDYCVGMATADADVDLADPGAWTKSDDCVFSRADDVGAYGPASMIWFTSPDGLEDWVVYHIKTTAQVTGGDRQLQAKPVTWRSDGTPDLGRPLAPNAFIPLPSGDPGVTQVEAEDGRRDGAKVERSALASGGRYVEIGTGAALTVTIEAPHAGMVPVDVWLRASTGRRPQLSVRVNGTTYTSLDVPVGGQSEGFGAGQFATISLPLEAGANTVEFAGVEQTTGIDRVRVRDVPVSDAVSITRSGTDLLVADVSRSGQLELRACDGGACRPFTPPPPAPVALTGSPAVTSRDGTGLDLFALGADGSLRYAAYDGNAWADWADLGSPPSGIAPGGVSVAARTPANLDVYVLGTDGQLKSTAWEDGGDWIGWFTPDRRGYGVGQVSAPSAVGRAASQLDLASVGSDGHIWLTWWDGRGWNTSYPVPAPPGGATSAPALASREPAAFDIVVRGVEGDVLARTFTESGGWSGWATIPGTPPGGATSAPALTADHDSGTATAVIEADGRWWSAELATEGTWSPWAPVDDPVLP